MFCWEKPENMSEITKFKRLRTVNITSFKKIVDETLTPIYRDYNETDLIDLESTLVLLENKFSRVYRGRFVQLSPYLRLAVKLAVTLAVANHDRRPPELKQAAAYVETFL